MTRTTKAELDQLVTVLNERLGRPQYGWYRFGDKNHCRVGAFTLDVSYGQPRLQEVVNDGGRVREIGPRQPRGQMAQYIRAMIHGIDYAETNIGGYDSLPRWDEGRPSQPTPQDRLDAVKADLADQRARGAEPSLKRAVARVDGTPMPNGPFD